MTPLENGNGKKLCKENGLQISLLCWNCTIHFVVYLGECDGD